MIQPNPACCLILSLCLLFSNTKLEMVQHELPLERWCLINAMRVLLLVMMDLTRATCSESLDAKKLFSPGFVANPAKPVNASNCITIMLQ